MPMTDVAIAAGYILWCGMAFLGFRKAAAAKGGRLRVAARRWRARSPAALGGAGLALLAVGAWFCAREAAAQPPLP